MRSMVSISRIIRKTREASTIKRTSDGSTISRDYERCVKEERVREIVLKLHLHIKHTILYLDCMLKIFQL